MSPQHTVTHSLVFTTKRKPEPTLNQLPRSRYPHHAEPSWEVLDTALLRDRTRAGDSRSEAGWL